MEKDEVIKHWLTSAKRDIGAAQDMFKLGHYHWCLFLWHLAIEKALKAKIVSLDKTIPPIHNLVQLARIAELNSTKEDKELLNEISTYNIEARYDDYRLKFYKKASKTYTEKWINICKAILDSLKEQI